MSQPPTNRPTNHPTSSNQPRYEDQRRILLFPRPCIARHSPSTSRHCAGDLDVGNRLQRLWRLREEIATSVDFQAKLIRHGERCFFPSLGFLIFHGFGMPKTGFGIAGEIRQLGGWARCNPHLSQTSPGSTGSIYPVVNKPGRAKNHQF